jgi:SAM-dependent methyltransferase
MDPSQLIDAEEYLHFMAGSLAAEDTTGQVAFLERALAMAPPMRVIDLGCGHGRHALELARRGYRVLGVDLVEGFLAVARREAAAAGLAVAYERADMAELAHVAAFDRAVCLYDAFGWSDDAHQRRTLAAVARALVPGGRLLLDLRTREYMTRLPPAAVLDLDNGDLMIDRHHFDARTGRFVDRRTYLRGTARRDVTFSIRIWAYTEIVAVLEPAGFVVEAAFGGFDGGELSPHRPRTLLVCRLPEPAGSGSP